MSVDTASLKKQLECQKTAVIRYREAKHALQEKLAKREEVFKHMEANKADGVSQTLQTVVDLVDSSEGFPSKT